ncbi:hypothetical protein GWA97_00310 [Flavobacterium sp. LaA7.5]|nr:hypothetical protein [Flavobacterium salilacus subsp. altitudinum]
MHYVKNIIVVLCVSLPVFLGCGTNKATAQLTLAPSPYEGTWHYQDGNDLFIVSLWKDDDGSFRGYYKKTAYTNGTIGATIFNSRKINVNGVVFPPVIYGDFNDGSGVSGVICDNTMENNLYDCKDGVLRMKIISDCTNCPMTATWKVEETSGMRVNFIPGFSIPTDVILTKVSDEIDVE